MEQLATLRVKRISGKAWYEAVTARVSQTSPTYISTAVNYRWFGRIGEERICNYEICIQWGAECKVWSDDDFAECFSQMEQFLISNK